MLTVLISVAVFVGQLILAAIPVMIGFVICAVFLDGCLRS